MAPGNIDFETVRKDIASLIGEIKDYDDGSIGPVLVRLAWHAAGTYDVYSDTGGSNGAGMRYEAEGGDGANAGLQHARAFLEPIKKKHDNISYADLWTLAGTVAIEAMKGPKIPWQAGRTDALDDKSCPPRGRLPDASQGSDHLRHVFYRMGFNDQEIVALSGAHNLGRCHADRSGFSGPWVNNPTRFSNQYFKLLLKLDWQPKKWDGNFQYAAKAPGAKDGDEELMMLPTDYALVQDRHFKKWVEVYAEDRDRFFNDFSNVFERLMELGVYRDETGIAKIGGKRVDYIESAGKKKSDKPEAPEKTPRGQKARM
ncbi:unnamed protein product [Tilletia controversa]|uniref:Peroxidase n=3 Tax=Tilletia TaxID=13289 RepID=A0A8X7SXX8_9BASI|nr:hypothetical protein CF336_g5824 [Tilletia laevis]KAE8202249.1 hypothetical protein CF328_g2320 [Tilletia controversa]KAE8256565.1 hypothetical protein A4X03_0g5279 [Tilletia caries]KAE8194875.1 hypothetical protein CF335_g5230 [Tilletia laevis]KAE8249297.1 hypothetical protein A4X06_0g3296 [Tilletia controversa]